MLSQAGLIGTNWNRDKFGGMVTDSIVVFVVRKGNPKNIKTWNDLIKPGIQVINANPFTSGGARWNVMAAWGAQIKQHKTPTQANTYLKALYKNITVQDSSARASMNTFVQGKGDVLLAYENEAIQAQQAGADIQFVRPSATILIENPIAVLKGTQNPTQAKAFVDFTRSRRRAEHLGAVRLPPGRAERLQEVGEDVPGPQAAVHDPRHRQGRLARRAAQVLRSEQRHRQADPEHLSDAWRQLTQR